jgi:glycosyltransferase involved in cell wall biosynthesis
MNVGVILCAYNRAQLLARTIRSVLAQTYHSFELIIIDDGSTDNTKELVAQFDDPRIKYLVHERNKGLSAARNTGLAQTTGEYIAFIDSDDEWEKDKLEKQMAFLADKQTPIFIFSNSLKIEDGCSAVHERDPAILTQRYYYKMYSVTAPSTWVISSDVFKLTGYFDEEFYRFDDIDFLFRMCKCHITAYYLAEVVAKKYYHCFNLSTVSVATLKAREQFYEKHKKALRQESEYIFKLYAKMGKDAFLIRGSSLARRDLRALVYKPLRIDLWFKIILSLCPKCAHPSKKHRATKGWIG